ncbi:MAG: hypothetical protein NVSMB52_04550 [Chloroflexota bacterium]
MSYGQFLALFLGVPLLVLSLLMYRRLSARLLALFAGISLVALVYTAPWDNLIVVNGVWTYSTHQILGVVIGHVPLEEYLFYILQVFLTGLVTIALLRPRNRF